METTTQAPKGGHFDGLAESAKPMEAANVTNKSHEWANKIIF
jgi:hypothetical protein